MDISYLIKDLSVHNVVRRLAARLGGGAFDVRDYWEADMWAIGLASLHDPKVLAYINTGGRANGPYFLGFELPPDFGTDEEYKDAGNFSDLSFDDLADQIAAHFSRENIGS